MGRLFLTLVVLGILPSCAQKTAILERSDGTYVSVATDTTEKLALKTAATKAQEMCKSMQSRFALVDRRTTHHGAKDRKPAAKGEPEQVRVELVFACK